MDLLPCEIVILSCSTSSQLVIELVCNICPVCGFYRIGISEKGQATVKLSVRSAPGHSSMPPRESSIGILASAVKRQTETPDTFLKL